MTNSISEASREVARLSRDLDITNADHIALWIEANTIPDEPTSQCASWLACRIVEAHEAAMSRASQPVDTGVATYAPPTLQWASVDQHDAWLLRFADQDCGDQWFGGADYSPGEAKAQAIEAWNRYAPAWSVRLMRTVTLDEIRGITPPLDSEAVERVRAALLKAQECLVLGHYNDGHAAINHALRALLSLAKPVGGGQ